MKSTEGTKIEITESLSFVPTKVSGIYHKIILKKDLFYCVLLMFYIYRVGSMCVILTPPCVCTLLNDL